MVLEALKLYFRKKIDVFFAVFGEIIRHLSTKNHLRHQSKQWVSRRPFSCVLGDRENLPYPDVTVPPADLPDFPSYVALEVTNMCNLQCKHCNYRYGLPHYTRGRGFITQDLVNRVFDEVKKYNSTILLNYDGEPLMHKDFLLYLEMATKNGISTYFNTNGTLFNREFSNRIVEFYRGTIFFSIDGDKEWFEKIRIPADYNNVVKNVEYFLEVNEKRGWPIKVGIGFCNLGQTYRERYEFLKRWIGKVNMVSMGEVNDKNGTMISSPMTVIKVRRRPVCVVPWQTCGICFNGDVIPCSIFVTRANETKTIFGNITQKSIKDIWHGKDFWDFRVLVRSNRIKDTYCNTCQRWLSQFTFPPQIIKWEGYRLKVVRNGYWTVYYNLSR